MCQYEEEQKEEDIFCKEHSFINFNETTEKEKEKEDFDDEEEKEEFSDTDDYEVRWKNASSSIVEPGLRVWSIGFFRRARA
jgi:hypothetical protein